MLASLSSNFTLRKFYTFQSCYQHSGISLKSILGTMPSLYILEKMGWRPFHLKGPYKLCVEYCRPQGPFASSNTGGRIIYILTMVP